MIGTDHTPVSRTADDRAPGRLALLASMRELALAETRDEVYDVVSTWVSTHLDSASGSDIAASIATVDPGGETVTIVSVDAGDPLADLGITNVVPLDGTAFAEAISTRRTVHWVPSEHPDRVEAALLTEHGWTDALNVPIILAGSAVGTLNVARRADDRFPAALVEQIEELAALVAATLERFAKVDSIRSDLDRSLAQADALGRLAELAVELSSIDDEDTVLELVAAAISHVVPIERVAIGEPADGGDDLELRNIRDDSGGTSPGMRTSVPIATSNVGHVYRSGRPSVFPDLSDSPYPEHRALVELGLNFGMCVPIAIGGRVGGVLTAASTRAGELGADEMRTVAALSMLTGANLERIRAQAESESRADELKLLIDDSPLMLMTITADGGVARMSRFGARRLGQEPGQLVGGPVAGLYHPDDVEGALTEFGALIDAPPGTVRSWASRMTDAHGVDVWVRHTGRRLDATGRERAADHLLVVCEDITELQAMSQLLEQEAARDPLTRLANRREFDKRLDAVAAAGNQPVSLCFIDIDRFKLINDTAGHQAGDAILMQLAQVLDEVIDRDDTLARVGGDEFALLLNDCGLADAVRVAERLRQRAEAATIDWSGRALPVTLSIGVATLDRGAGIDALITAADAACYYAKSTGRNRVATPGDGEETRRHTDGTWVKRLQEALDADALVLSAQPIAPLCSDDRLWNFEVLVRMSDGDDLVPAGVFIPATERYGLITDLDRWVVTRVVDTLRARPDLATRIGFCTINLSARSIENETFLEFLLELLSVDRFPSHLLVFEITETTALSQFHTAIRFIESVSALGCRFALDDFGAGFSTYQYLKQLPVHMLKIDGSLVRDIAIDPVNREIVRSMAQVAIAIGMGTVAEYVEDARTSAVLGDLDVGYAQGWGIGRPRRLTDLLADVSDGVDPPSAGAPG